MMFINSNLGLLLPEKLGAAVLAAGLSQALGSAAGIIEAIGLVALFGGLTGAAISALAERHLSGVKTSSGLQAENWSAPKHNGKTYV
jgi:hypothetical protein